MIRPNHLLVLGVVMVCVMSASCNEEDLDLALLDGLDDSAASQDLQDQDPHGRPRLVLEDPASWSASGEVLDENHAWYRRRRNADVEDAKSIHLGRFHAQKTHRE